MPMKHLYTLMCDDVRKEDTGKLIFIGVYTPDIGVPQIPFTFPRLTFFVALESDRPEDHTFRMKLSHLETGKVVAQGDGGIQMRRPGKTTMIIPFPGIQFEAVGIYSLSVDLNDPKENLLVHNFSVELRVPKQKN